MVVGLESMKDIGVFNDSDVFDVRSFATYLMNLRTFERLFASVVAGEDIQIIEHHPTNGRNTLNMLAPLLHPAVLRPSAPPPGTAEVGLVAVGFLAQDLGQVVILYLPHGILYFARPAFCLLVVCM